MNDIVFADKYSAFERAGVQKFNKCLKVLVPKENGRGGQIAFGQNLEESDWYACGEYVAIPPYSNYKILKPDSEDLIVCIEQPLLPSSLPVFIVTNTVSQGMRSAVNEAIIYFNKEYLEPADGIISALGQLIVAYVADDYPIKLHPVVVMLKADMEKNFTDSTYSAETALRKIPLNYDYVRKLFKKETGITPREYLTHVRMNRAMVYIANGITNNYSNFTVSQIAEACGFAEPLYFSRVFKKYCGLSPMAYIE
ncbi:MAG: helix-turn-helix transcriptional regulator, partial [Candidatus Coproplasma sp.]